MVKRQRNDGLRKICKCSLRSWVRCPHPWYFSFKPRGGERVRVSLDRYAGKRIELLEDAKTLAAELRTKVAAGEYPPPVTPAVATPDAVVVTFKTAADRFLEAVPMLKGKNQGKPRGTEERQKVAKLCAWIPPHSTPPLPLGQMPAGSVTEDVYEAFIQSLRAQGRAASTVTNYLQLVKSLDRWLAKKGYRPSPAISGESDVLRRTKGAQRDRRLQPDTVNAEGTITAEGEERRLLKVAGPWLQRLILAALETGCRRGELLGLRWGDVDLTRGEIVVRGETNKTGKARRIPISARLRPVLDMIRLDPAGKERPADHYVFGNAVGEPAKSIKKGWETAVLRAHGHEPTWTDKRCLTRESREHLRRIDLHFHDLRHEAGSRLLEAHWPLNLIQRMLGHATAAQTSTYLNADNIGLQDAMKRYGTSPAWQSVAKPPEIAPLNDGHGEDAPSPQATIN